MDTSCATRQPGLIQTTYVQFDKDLCSLCLNSLNSWTNMWLSVDAHQTAQIYTGCISDMNCIHGVMRWCVKCVFYNASNHQQITIHCFFVRNNLWEILCMKTDWKEVWEKCSYVVVFCCSPTNCLGYWWPCLLYLLSYYQLWLTGKF